MNLRQILNFFARRVLPFLCVAGILVFYARVQVANLTPGYNEPDPDGYLVLAKRIAHKGPVALPDSNPFLHQSHVWVENVSGDVVPKYTFGYPLILVPFYLFFGDAGMFYASPILGGLTLIGAYFLFRLWISTFPAICAVLTLAANGMFLMYSDYLLAHAADMCFVTWGMYFLWRWTRAPSVTLGTTAGLLLGYSVAIRPVNALLFLAVVTAAITRFVQDFRQKTFSSKNYTALVAGSFVFLFLLAWYNLLVFDNAFTTGYSLSDEQCAFTWETFKHKFASFLTGLDTSALGFVFPLGLVGMLIFGSAGERIMRALWFLPLYILYSSYYWTHPGVSALRFMTATFPLLAGCAYALIENAAASRAVSRVISGLFCALLLTISMKDALGLVSGISASNTARNIAAMAQRCEEKLKPDAVIFGEHPAIYNIGTRRYFELYDLNAFRMQQYAVNGAHGNPRMQELRFQKLRKLYEKASPQILAERKKELIVSFLQAGKQVVFIVLEQSLDAQKNELGEDLVFTPIEQWEQSDSIWGRGDIVRKWGLYEIRVGNGKSAE